MATSTFRNKNLVRPRKTGHARNQRIKRQRRRLMDLGVPAEQVEQMTTKDVREMLKRPKKVAEAYQNSDG